MKLTLKEREALRDWELYKKNLLAATPIDLDEGVAEKQKRIAALQEDEVAFCKYYFPHHCKSEFSFHHKKLLKKVARAKRKNISRKWHRGGGKTTVAMMGWMFRILTGRTKNLLTVSRTETNAVDTQKPFMLELELNQRIINDFGTQKKFGSWDEQKFTTMNGCTLRAIGMGQNPRGTKDQEVRPDGIWWDDGDDEEVCRNPKRLDEAYEWITGSLFNCFDVEKGGLFLATNNVIAKDCLIKRMGERGFSDDDEEINVIEQAGEIDKKKIKEAESKVREAMDEKEKKIWTQVLNWLRDGYRPSWHEHLSLYSIAYILVTIGTRMFQREYMNNPTSEGKVFKSAWFQFCKIPPLSQLKFMLAYLDPSFKKTKNSDSKALVLLALYGSKFYIIKVFCGQASTEEMIEWGYSMDTYVKAGNGAYIFKMEQVFLQDLLYKDFAAAAEKKKYPLPVSGDQRKKPDKDARIEATSGYFERGDVYLNEAEKQNHHMQTLIEQYLNFEPGVKTKKDGPDAVEGAMFLLRQSVNLNADISVGRREMSGKHRI